MKLEYRKTAIESADEGVVTAHLTRWDTVDDYNSTFLRGAFAASFARIIPKLIFDHYVLAGRILEAMEDDTGPFVRGQFNLNTTAGRDAYEHVKAGDVDCFSFGFISNQQKEQWNVDGVREIGEVQVMECGPVIFPANDHARIISVRSAGNVTVSNLAMGRSIERLIATMKG